MQGFYHGLIQKSHEQLGATTRGLFMLLTLRKVEALMEKIASNHQSLGNTHATRARKY